MIRATIGIFMCTLVFVSGCTTYHIKVNGFSDPEKGSRLVPGSIFVVENPKAENPIFEKEIKAKVLKLLEKQGYQISNFQDADYYLILAYGIGSGRNVIGALPFHRPGGTATMETFGPSGMSQSTINLPGSTSFIPYNRTVYDRWLIIMVVDGKNFRNNNEISTLWYGEITSGGSNSDLREVIDYLLISGFDYFGVNTGKAVRVQMLQGDSRLQSLGIE